MYIDNHSILVKLHNHNNICQYMFLLSMSKMCQIYVMTQIAKFMGPTWGPPGSCRPQMGPMLALWTLLSGDRSNTCTWWRHQMETFSTLLTIRAGNSPVPDEFPTQRPVMQSFHVYLDLCPNKRLSKQSWGWWFETPSRPLWRHHNESSTLLLCPHPHVLLDSFTQINRIITLTSLEHCGI